MNAKPKLLIGIQHSRLLAPLKCQMGQDEEDPIAIRTELGWIVFGKTTPLLNIVAVNQRLSAHFQFHMTEPTRMDDELHQLVKRFFATEEFGVAACKAESDSLSSQDERRAQKIIDDTMKTVGDRMEISLFWKSDDVELPNSYPMALKRGR